MVINPAADVQNRVPATEPNSGRRVYSAPQPGRSLGGAIVAVRRPLRAAVAALCEAPDLGDLGHVFKSGGFGAGGTVEPAGLRLAWLLVNACVVHSIHERRTRLSSISESVKWFFHGSGTEVEIISRFSELSLRVANNALAEVVIDQEFLDLYPYLIEPQGHVARSSLRDQAARKVRKSKKEDGVYYTPSDVADFMVAELAKSSSSSGAWIDPACGTGVFLRSILSHALISGKATWGELDEYLQRFVFGIDKSALAVDSCAFVLLSELQDRRDVSPFARWLRIKENLSCMDSLSLMPDCEDPDLLGPPPSSTRLESLFPNCVERFTTLVMNPPYAQVDRQKSTGRCWVAIKGAGSGGRFDIHLAFAEMLWRFNTIEAAAAVLPLSVATNTSKVYRSVRKALATATGRTEMLFFDREPQALFGEDIKTRNAIIFRFALQGRSFHTSSLLKWTAPQRPQIFSRERLVKIAEVNTERFVPKLGSPREACAYRTLKAMAPVSLDRFIESTSRRQLDSLTLKPNSGRSTIAVSGTAYNFLNIFFAPDFVQLPTGESELSRSPVFCMEFVDDRLAHAAYALAANRIVYWLWRVEGDGFHVTVDFIKDLPVWGLLGSSEAELDELSSYGRSIRESARSRVTRSINSGRETYAFHSGFEGVAVRKTEEFIVSRLGLSGSFSKELDQILHAATSVDGRSRRMALM